MIDLDNLNFSDCDTNSDGDGKANVNVNVDAEVAEANARFSVDSSIMSKKIKTGIMSDLTKIMKKKHKHAIACKGIHAHQHSHHTHHTNSNNHSIQEHSVDFLNKVDKHDKPANVSPTPTFA